MAFNPVHFTPESAAAQLEPDGVVRRLAANHNYSWCGIEP